jgi:hypothetical protein
MNSIATPPFLGGGIAPSAAIPSSNIRQAVQYPLLYQVNTRLLLTSLTRVLGRPATLDDVSDGWIDRISAQGFQWVWFLGVWQTGAAGRRISLENPEWRREFEELLPDFTDKDVCGSCFSIRSYSVHTDFGGNGALERLRQRLMNWGIRLLLDFVPNHMAPDHPWTQQHPEFFLQAGDAQLESEPHNYARVITPRGPMVMAHGRDPYFAGWPDTLQLNYANPDLQEAMKSELENIAAMCDGVRCDMAMLILPDVFERTWGVRPPSFWPVAIARVRARYPRFLFMAEVYWDLEWRLQQQGFDYTYDKRLYDRLREGHAQPVHDHFFAGMDFQKKSVRFLENHDEPRAADVFPLCIHQPAAIVTFLCPGLRFIHQGQMDGFRKKIPVHLSRGPTEAGNRGLRDFYDRLIRCLRHPALKGDWQLIDCNAAWEGNWTSECFIGFAWRVNGKAVLAVAVNYAPHQSQCFLRVPIEQVSGKAVLFQDLMGPKAYERAAEDLRARGLYLDLPAWGYHVFEVSASFE